MLFHVGKCTVVHFGRANRFYDYNMCNCKVKVLIEEKEFGV